MTAKQTGSLDRNTMSLALSVSLALSSLRFLYDISIHQPVGLASLPVLLGLVFETSALLFLGYLALLIPITSRLQGRAARNRTSITTGLSVFVASLLILLYTGGVHSLDAGAPRYVAVVVFFLVSLLASFPIGRLLAASGPGVVTLQKILARALGAVTVLFGATVFAWACVYPDGGPLLPIVVAAATVAVGLLWHRGARRPRPARLVLAILLGGHALILAISLAAILGRDVAGTARPGSSAAEHDVGHVILIIDDTLRADMLGCYDPTAPKTPNIDRLAADGVLFANAYAPSPWTLPSVASVMTGYSPLVHGAVDADSALPEGFDTLAEQLAERGYWTAAIGDNPVLDASYKFDQGFEEYVFFPMPESKYPVSYSLLKRLFPSYLFGPEVTTDELTAIASDWLQTNRARDFFLWLHYYDPHQPYAPPPRFLEGLEVDPTIGIEFSQLVQIRAGYLAMTPKQKAWAKELYAAEVRHVDENIGRIIAELERLGIYDDSLIIFTSDHGEEFWEHGDYEHGHTLYNELLRVPLIIKVPGGSAPRRIETPVSIQSILPTVLDICGVSSSDTAYPSGSLQPLLSPNGEEFVERPIYATGIKYHEDREAIIFDNLKWIRFLSSNAEELYDLSADPGETRSLAPDRPGALAKMRALSSELRRRDAEIRRSLTGDTSQGVKLDPETRDRLRSLGYVQ